MGNEQGRKADQKQEAVTDFDNNDYVGGEKLQRPPLLPLAEDCVYQIFPDNAHFKFLT